MIATRRAALAAALATPIIARAQGQAWPSRPVRLVVPFPPGGSNDVVARPVADRMQARLGVPVVIENRGGAAGAIGAGQVAAAAPDGYTVMVTSSSFLTSSIIQRVNWTVVGNFKPVALLARAPFFIIVRDDHPARNVSDLVRMARERPGSIDYGTSGAGGINHFITEYFCLRANVRMNHVPYRGTAPAVTDLVAGHIGLMITTMASASGVVREGRVRILAYTAPGAPPGSLPAPTVREAGIDYETDIHWGLYAPKGLPRPITERLNAAANAALAEPDIARLIEAEGARPAPGTPEQFAALIGEELGRWREVARAADIRAE